MGGAAVVVSWYGRDWLLAKFLKDTPPERLVTSGPFALSRNPMYLGHLIFLAGLALSLRSWLAVIFLVVTALRLVRRVRRDEQRLAERFGEAYLEYRARVKRWIPALF